MGEGVLGLGVFLGGGEAACAGVMVRVRVILRALAWRFSVFGVYSHVLFCMVSMVCECLSCVGGLVGV